MNRKKILIISGAILLICLLFSPCHATETVKVGAIFAKTGRAVNVSDGIRLEFLAVRMAVKELNARGGLLGKPVEILEFDNQSSALGAKQAAEEAVKAKVVAVIGSTRSSQSLGMAPVLQAARIPMITPISTNPAVTLVGDYIFRVCFIDDFQGEIMASFAVKELRAKTAVVLTNASEKYSIGLSNFFIAKFKELDGTILWESHYLGDAVDFEKQVLRLKELQPDVTFIPGNNPDVGFIIKQARAMGIKSIFLSGDGPGQGLYRYAQDAAVGMYKSDHWHVEDLTPKSRGFVEAFIQQYHQPVISPAAALSYDAVMLLADAVERAKSLEPASIRAALSETKGFQGITGKITFDTNRNPVNKSAVILKYGINATEYGQTINP